MPRSYWLQAIYSAGTLNFNYEELEKLPMASIDSLYAAHVLEKNG
ncbi:hypothetical protein ABE867_02360 [Enterococcus gallinarum]|nr:MULTISPECIES: hypothetical protein [Enterococcus]